MHEYGLIPRQSILDLNTECLIIFFPVCQPTLRNGAHPMFATCAKLAQSCYMCAAAFITILSL